MREGNPGFLPDLRVHWWGLGGFLVSCVVFVRGGETVCGVALLSLLYKHCCVLRIEGGYAVRARQIF